MSKIYKFLGLGLCLSVILSLAALSLKAAGQETADNQTGDPNDSSSQNSTELSESEKELEALKRQIAFKNEEIKKIEAEIENYKKQISETGKQATSLKAAIKALEATKAKLTSDIKLTEKKIQVANLNIERLGLAISDKKERISQGLRTIESALQAINEMEARSPMEIILGKENFYDGWNDLENLARFEGGMNDHLDYLKSLKRELENNKQQSEKEKKNLASLKYRLSDQRVIVEQNKKEQNQLLAETKNKETEYRKQLADRLAKKEELEQEILDFEAQLKVAVDSSLLPAPGHGTLSWPLDSIRITQFFGNTPFASQNPQVYNGKGHNGVDFGASVGTSVKSAGDGIVTGTGNTDSACYGVSYGKWVLIKHNNGLSTLYAHLSLIKVGAGEGVSKGDVIGYSGNTGYTTGPHLHFTVYATQAVHISGPTEYKSRVCKSYMKLPLAPREGYLNPLSYL